MALINISSKHGCFQWQEHNRVDHTYRFCFCSMYIAEINSSQDWHIWQYSIQHKCNTHVPDQTQYLTEYKSSTQKLAKCKKKNLLKQKRLLPEYGPVRNGLYTVQPVWADQIPTVASRPGILLARKIWPKWHLLGLYTISSNTRCWGKEGTPQSTVR